MSSPRHTRHSRAGGARSADQPRPVSPGSPVAPRRSAEVAGASREGASSYATAYHDPVLVRETVELLVTDPVGVYVDGTLGGGGHSAALLDALGPDATVIGIDRDPEALRTASARLAEAVSEGRFIPVHATFAEMGAALAGEGIAAGSVSGVLLDLGVSSRQLDEGARGFAYAKDGPLDMRMNPETGEPASDLIARLDADDLADVIYEFGDERRSRRLARAIKGAERMETTADLAAAVRQSTPDRDEVKTLARVFQALRIAVNGEIEQIEAAFPAALRVLAPGGRLAAIAYHSLEDRRAKRFLRHGSFERDPQKDDFGRVISPLRAVTRKPVIASDDETAANPRARSARLRVAEKTSD